MVGIPMSIVTVNKPQPLQVLQGLRNDANVLEAAPVIFPSIQSRGINEEICGKPYPIEICPQP
jgi:hypothetical protein